MMDMANKPMKMSESKPELRIEAHFDSFGGSDSEYDKERKKRNAERHKAITQAIKDLTPDKAYKMAKASLDKELRRCEIEAMEFEDEPTIDEAYDDKGDDEADEG